MLNFADQSPRIAIIGLGYVGLPLAVEFGKHFETIGFDINTNRIADLRQGLDSTLECSAEELAGSPQLRYADTLEQIRECNVYIVTVPTPIDAAKRPDLTPLVKASQAIGSVLKAGDLVVYESTVYPGCTEEVCVPILEQVSGLCFDGSEAIGEATDHSLPPSGRDARRAERGPEAIGEATDHSLPPSGRDARRAERGSEAIGEATDHSLPPSGRDARRAERGFFSVGYSPERINPGDKAHRLPNIKKVTSGSTPEAADFVDSLYARIITAGTHKAPSLKVAEAAKVIENTQRDLNIALINDLAILFNKLGIDTLDVLEAAGTKWNFLPFRPGLVGGHCIGVDPYYLTHKAQEVGHHPQVILAGRRTNDGMGGYVADQVIKLMLRRSINPVQARVLVLGLAFKENCPDLRNTRVVDIVEALRGYNAQVDVHDPWVSAAEAEHEFGLQLCTQPQPATYDAIILAVAHDQFRQLGGQGVRAFGKPEACVVFDVKHLLPRDAVDGRL